MVTDYKVIAAGLRRDRELLDEALAVIESLAAAGAPKRRGRPPGSKNRPKATGATAPAAIAESGSAALETAETTKAPGRSSPPIKKRGRKVLAHA